MRGGGHVTYKFIAFGYFNYDEQNGYPKIWSDDFGEKRDQNTICALRKQNMFEIFSVFLLSLIRKYQNFK